MRTIPISIKEANVFVAKYHRHSIPTSGGKFAIGCQHNEQLVGVAICGRPIARLADNGHTLEVLRVCTDGTKQVNSFLYDKCRKIAALLGYDRVITYTLQSESGASLRALGATRESAFGPRSWDMPGRKRNEQAVYKEPKYRWSIPLPL